MAEQHCRARKATRLDDLDDLAHEALEGVVEHRAVGRSMAIQIEAQRLEPGTQQRRHQEIEFPARHRGTVDQDDRRAVFGTFASPVCESVAESKVLSAGTPI